MSAHIGHALIPSIQYIGRLPSSASPKAPEIKQVGFEDRYLLTSRFNIAIEQEVHS